jgi:hypothetical protein
MAIAEHARRAQDDVFFDQVCDEVEGTYKDKSGQ